MASTVYGYSIIANECRRIFFQDFIFRLCSYSKVFVESHGSTELFKNADMEQSSFHGSWVCNGCTVTRSNDYHHGHQSAMITHRRANWAGLQQTMTVTEGHTYVYRGWIKLLNDSPGHMYTNVDIMARIPVNGHNKFVLISRMIMLRKELGWVEIGGDVTIPAGGNSVVIYPQIDHADINYLLDDMSFQELSADSNWKTEANKRIDSIRKSNLHVSIQNPSSIDTTDVEVEINQVKHSFAFGTAVNSYIIVRPDQQKYQKFFYDNFEWAVLKNMLKWRLMEWNRGHANYDPATKAIAALHAKGIKIRGHAMFWDVPGHAPAWLNSLSKSDFLGEMKKRVTDTISHTRGKLEHWDVNNEALHGDYFEQHLGDPNITSKMFQWIHTAEPGVKLFLNDYNVVSIRQYTVPLKEQARVFRESGVPIYGVGVQSHFHTSDIDIDAVKFRLDKVAEAGLPIWITELTVSDHDENKKAEAIEKLLTLYFSHPSVEGVLFWGVWDGDIGNKINALANGPDITPNAAGRKYLELKSSWTTNTKKALSHGTTSFTLSGFHGDYQLNVKKSGRVIETKTFSLGPKGNSLTINLSGSNSHPSSTSVFG